MDKLVHINTLDIIQVHTRSMAVSKIGLSMLVGIFHSVRPRTKGSGNADLCLSLDFFSWRAVDCCLDVKAINFQFDAVVDFMVNIEILRNLLLQHVVPPKHFKGCLDNPCFTMTWQSN